MINAQLRRAPRFRIKFRTIIHHVILVCFMLIIILPLAWVLLLSVKSLPDAYSGTLWPERFDFSHYGFVFEHIRTLPRNLFNSVVITSISVTATTAFAVLGSYALVHLKLSGTKLIILGLTLTLFFPTRVVSLISIYETQRTLGLINSSLGLTLPYITLNLAISLLIMRSIFLQIPKELIDATKIDGCTTWGTFRVILPLVRNGIIVITIVNFVAIWGEYLLAATLTNDQELRTLPVVLASAASGRGQWAWPRIAAVYVIVVFPGLAAFIAAQRYFFKGLLEGALKF
jgi:ABC-type glycerol-3-phosphate transport system permease component